MSETQPRSHAVTEPRNQSRRHEVTPWHALGTRAKARGGKKRGGGGEGERAREGGGGDGGREGRGGGRRGRACRGARGTQAHIYMLLVVVVVAVVVVEEVEMEVVVVVVALAVTVVECGGSGGGASGGGASGGRDGGGGQMRLVCGDVKKRYSGENSDGKGVRCVTYVQGWQTAMWPPL